MQCNIHDAYESSYNYGSLLMEIVMVLIFTSPLWLGLAAAIYEDL